MQLPPEAPGGVYSAEVGSQWAFQTHLYTHTPRAAGLVGHLQLKQRAANAINISGAHVSIKWHFLHIF